MAQSVVIRPDWTVLEQFQCSALAKLSHPQPSAEKGTVTDLAFCGSLEHYDRDLRQADAEDREPAAADEEAVCRGGDGVGRRQAAGVCRRRRSFVRRPASRARRSSPTLCSRCS